MTFLEKLTGCSGCAQNFNAASVPAVAVMEKPQPRLQDICPCYRPKI